MRENTRRGVSYSKWPICRKCEQSSPSYVAPLFFDASSESEIYFLSAYKTSDLRHKQPDGWNCGTVIAISSDIQTSARSAGCSELYFARLHQGVSRPEGQPRGSRDSLGRAPVHSVGYSFFFGLELPRQSVIRKPAFVFPQLGRSPHQKGSPQCLGRNRRRETCLPSENEMMQLHTRFSSPHGGQWQSTRRFRYNGEGAVRLQTAIGRSSKHEFRFGPSSRGLCTVALLRV